MIETQFFSYQEFEPIRHRFYAAIAALGYSGYNEQQFIRWFRDNHAGADLILAHGTYGHRAYEVQCQDVVLFKLTYL